MLQLFFLLGRRTLVLVLHPAAIARLLFFSLLLGNPLAVLRVLDERGLAAEDAAQVEAGVLGGEGPAVAVEYGVQRMSREADLPRLIARVSRGRRGGDAHFGIAGVGLRSRRFSSFFSFLAVLVVCLLAFCTPIIRIASATISNIFLGKQKRLADVGVLHVDPPPLHAGDAVGQIDAAAGAIFGRGVGRSGTRVGFLLGDGRSEKIAHGYE